MDFTKNILRKLREAGPTRMDYSKATDDELVELIQKKKDKKAEEVLIKRYDRLLYKIAQPYYAGGNDEDDLHQEALIAFMKAYQSYSPNTSGGNSQAFSRYMGTFVKRRLIDVIRSANSYKNSTLNKAYDLDQLENETNPQSDMHMKRPRNNPADLVIQKQAEQRLKKYMDKNLSVLQKSVLSYYLQGYSYADIAKKLGRNRKSVDNAMMEVRKKMSEYKEKYLNDSKIIKMIEGIINDDKDEQSLEEARKIFNY